LDTAVLLMASPTLRKALAEEMKNVYGMDMDVDVGMEDVALTAGCNLVFVATVMSLVYLGRWISHVS
jgi:hypothetical protein